MKNNDEWSNCLTNKREQKKKKESMYSIESINYHKEMRGYWKL
jgi:hypothetical protein